MPLLVELTASTDGGLRRKAVGGLGQLGGPDQLTTLLKLVRGRGSRRAGEVERAIVEVCDHADQGQKADSVLAFYASAGDADQPALLPLLGRLGGAKAAGTAPRWTDEGVGGMGRRCSARPVQLAE
ncbi:MAG: hypothetical protein U0736_02555 [Gemmataceae bacterium]